MQSVEETDETDTGELLTTTSTRCTLTPETQDLLRRVFADIVSYMYMHVYSMSLLVVHVHVLA